MGEAAWASRPCISKTLVKGGLAFLVLILFFGGSPLFPALALALFLFLIYRVLSKLSFSYRVAGGVLVISRRWLYSFERRVPLDSVLEVSVVAGPVAKLFKCGTVVLVTGSRLEVEKSALKPSVRKKPWNTLWDVKNPWKAAALLESRRVETVAEHLSKLKSLLDSGAITAEEFEKLKRRLLPE